MVSGKSLVLKQSLSALFISVSHMTKLPEITRVVNVRNQTSQASVTSSSPLRDCSCWFTNHRISGLPMRAKPKACQKDAKTNYLTSFFQCVETLFFCSMFLFANSQCSSMHFCACPARPSNHFSVSFLESGNFSVAPADFVTRTCCCTRPRDSCSVCIRVKPGLLDQEKSSVSPSQLVS